MLKKEDTLYKTDTEGRLMPMKVKSVKKINGEYVDMEIIPVLRTEYKDMIDEKIDVKDGKGKTSSDLDKELVLNNCANPNYTKDEIEFIPIDTFSAIVSTIMHHSKIINVEPEEDKSDVKQG